MDADDGEIEMFGDKHSIIGSDAAIELKASICPIVDVFGDCITGELHEDESSFYKRPES